MTDTDHPIHQIHHPNRSPPPKPIPKPPDHVDRYINTIIDPSANASSSSEDTVSTSDRPLTDTSTTTTVFTPSLSLADSPSHRPISPDSTMLATQFPSAIGGHMFSSPVAQKTPGTIQMELQQLKAAPILNPHFRMVQRYIDCLNWYIDVCVSSQGPAGIRAWILEVQWFTKSVQRRTYQRMPLTGEERQAIMQFSTYWRQQAHAPYMMNRPEVQVVLIALTETAYS